MSKKRCWSGKTRYHDQQEAKDALTRINQDGEVRDVMPTRVYRCDGVHGCGGWHLTHHDKTGVDGLPPLRRTPLKRKAALKASTPLKRGVDLRPKSKAKKAKESEEARVRGIVMERDGMACRIAKCLPDVPCYGHLTVHHLRKASQGGTYTPDNLITACVAHNDWVEDHPRHAQSLGLVIR